MKFHIVTPSYNQLGFLKRCIASVADQAQGAGGMEQGAGSGEPASRRNDLNDFNDFNGNASLSIHHHIQDGGSTDGTAEWLTEYVSCKPQTANYKLSFASEADEGMYDAISKGWIALTGLQEVSNPKPQTSNCKNVIVAWLNCDEQYLPGALQQVAQWFGEHPDKDVCFGDVLIIDSEGGLICGRKMVAPEKYHIMTDQLPLYTAAMFIRGSALEKYNLYPDPAWKNIGDVELVVRMMDSGAKIGLLPEYTSVFADTGKNMALDRLAGQEYAVIRSRAPGWARLLRSFWVLMHRLRKRAAGCYRLAPVSYSIYVDDLSCRTGFSEDRPEGRWVSRLR